MKISRKLNLVIEVEQDDGATLHVHSTPLARETFERYFKVIAKTFAKINGGGMGIVAGPRVCFLLLKETAIELGSWDGPEGVEAGLIAEMRRLSNVIVKTADRGWIALPLQHALDSGMISDDDAAEVEGRVAFFICASAMHLRNELLPILTAMAGLWQAQVTSLDSTAFAASLPTSTETASSGETVAGSSGASFPT